MSLQVPLTQSYCYKMSIFSGVQSNDSHQDTLLFDENRYTCHCSGKEHREQVNNFNVHGVEIDINTDGSQPTITIIPNYPEQLHYAMSTSIDNAEFQLDNSFTFDASDSNDYKVIIKDEKEIIYVVSTINLAYL